jgi:hypothetical protein
LSTWETTHDVTLSLVTWLLWSASCSLCLLSYIYVCTTCRWRIPLMLRKSKHWVLETWPSSRNIIEYYAQNES